ncbi:DgyrCDS1479 [Dimorphilus gyrociliatus]|uniref:DgyrCDS1479 n=1 Tax=Dimorphilus gyrociliatus TaxID=2664684 RepID=A0A7I8V7J0_9ANNE|nr:DgyrCDS1479 [Dimorphilus gyrociliatus]
MNPFCDNQVWRNMSKRIWNNEKNKEEWDDKFRKDVQSLISFIEKTNKRDSGSFWTKLTLRLTRLKMDIIYNIMKSEKRLNACGGTGFLTIVNHLNFTANSFFRSGKCFKVILRHANFKEQDDASLDTRVACLRLDDEEGQRLDLILTTGRAPLFWNALDLEKLLKSVENDEHSMKRWLFERPLNLFNTLESVRGDMNSYFDQQYFSNCLYEVESDFGEYTPCALRLIPADGTQQSGLPSELDQMNITRPGDNRKKDYLCQEYNSSLDVSPLQYRLQMLLLNKVEEYIEIVGLKKVEKTRTWQDLAIITICFPICNNSLYDLKFNLENHPESFRRLEVNDEDDFNSHSFIFPEFLGTISKPIKKIGMNETKKQILSKYSISFETGDFPEAATNSDVYISLTGKRKKSNRFLLENSIFENFESGKARKFSIELEEIDDLLAIDIELCKNVGSRNWFLNRVIVTDENGENSIFPCFRWLIPGDNGITLRNERECLPQYETSVFCYLKRKEELEKTRLQFTWRKQNSLPSSLNISRYENLPRNSRFLNDELSLNKEFKEFLSKTDTFGLNSIINIFDSWNPLTDSLKLASRIVKNKDLLKDLCEKSDSDEEFIRQLTSGPFSTRIRGIDKLPSYIEGGKKMYELIERKLDISEALKRGYIFLINYPEIDGLIRLGNTEVEPTCLIHLTENGKLMPLAIQINKNSKTIYTPLDKPVAWKFAKLLLKSIDITFYHLITMELYTRNVLEIFAVGLYRQLPCIHPVYQILQPFIKHIFAYNLQIFETVHESDIYNEILVIKRREREIFLRKAYNCFDLSKLHVPKDLSKRGLDMIDEQLWDNTFAELSLEFWKVLQKYVKSLISSYYRSSEDIQGDEELQSWIDDVLRNGFSKVSSHQMHNIPSSLKTKEELIDLVTLIIYTSTFRLASLTNSITELNGCVDMNPVKLKVEESFLKDLHERSGLKKFLPNRENTAKHLAMCKLLSTSFTMINNREAFSSELKYQEKLKQQAFSTLQMNILNVLKRFDEDKIKEFADPLIICEIFSIHTSKKTL